MQDSRYDYIADINGKLYKIQCKAAAISEDKSFIRFKCHMTNIRANTQTIYTNNDIDYFYTCYDNQSYLIPVNVGGKQEKILRFNLIQNHSTVMWAKDYTLEKVLTDLGYDYKGNEWERTVIKNRKDNVAI